MWNELTILKKFPLKLNDAVHNNFKTANNNSEIILFVFDRVK